MNEIILTPNEYRFDADERSLNPLIALIRRNLVLISAVVVLCLGAGALYLATATKMYVARVKLKVETHATVLPGEVEHDLLEKTRESTYFETQLQELKSLLLVNTILEFEPNLKEPFENELESRWFGAYDPKAKSDPYSYPTELLERYLRSISVEPVRRTSLVMLSAVSPDPSHAMTMANRHAETFVEWVRNSRVEKQHRAISHLEGQAEELREKIAMLERQMTDYAEENAIVAVNSNENIVVQRMAQLNKLVTQVAAERSEAVALAARGASAGDDDVAVQNTRALLAKLQAEYEELSAKFTPEYPRMKQLSAEIAKLERSIAGQRQEIREGLQTRASALKEHESKLRKELEESKTQAFELSRREGPYNSLARELDTSRSLLGDILKTMKELEVSVANGSATISIVDPASQPLRAAYPRPWLVLGLACIVALVINVVLLRVLNTYDTTVYSAEEASKAFEAPLLGTIPTSSTPPELLGQETGPWNELSEAFRNIRTSLLLSASDQPPQVIVVTSAEPGEGKTSVALNLAEALGALGKPVLVIDADTRRPKISLSINASGPGLVHLLSGQATIDEIVLSELTPTVSVLSVGDVPPNPSELLSAQSMAGLIYAMRERFAYIVIDAPPVLPVSDALILSRHADGVIMVVRSGITPRALVRASVERVRAVGAKVLGITLNDVDPRDNVYYGRYSYVVTPEREAIGA